MTWLDKGLVRCFHSAHQPDGKIALVKNGRPVWVGDINAPYDDVDFDTIIVSPRDYDRVSTLIDNHKREGEP